jgi:multidrug resistance protein, MATE family
MVTSIPLSFGYLLTYGEWELLTVFAAFLGPAEVATWGILGTLWDVLEQATEAIAEAAEVRCAYLLGAGKPVEAKNSSIKSIFLAFVVSTTLSLVVFFFGDTLAVLMTSDSTLQMLVSDLIPLFVIGNIALAMGTLSWTLIGAQGRYATSTAVGLVGSWLVTVPLAFLASYVLDWNLKGQTAAVVIGYMFSGTWNTFLLMTSNWKKISAKVIAYNSTHHIEIDSDQESECDDDDIGNADAHQGVDPPTGTNMEDSFRYTSSEF